MIDVALITGQVMPHGLETETPLLVAALRALGVDTAIVPWGSQESLEAGLVVVRTPWDYTSRLKDFLAWVKAADDATTVVNRREIIEWNAHKRYLLDLAYAAVPTIETSLVEQGSDEGTMRFLLDEHSTEVVIKPAVSVGASGTICAHAESEEAIAHLRALTAQGDALLQPFEPAIVDGEVSLMYLGGEFSHAVRKVPAEGDYRVQTFFGGSNFSHEPTDLELKVGAGALAAVDGEVTYARVDLVGSARGPVVMEVELIEPQLFLEVDGAAARYAEVLAALVGKPIG